MSKILGSPLPPAPEGDPFTPLQWTTFLAIADTFIASVRPASGPGNLDERCVPNCEYESAIREYRGSVADAVDDVVLERYFGEKLTDVDAFQPLLRRILLEYVKPDVVSGMGFLMDLLNTRAGSLLITGYTTPFQLHSVSTRELILEGWRESALPLLRRIYKSFSNISKTLWLKISPNIEPALGFPRVPDLGPPAKGYDFEFLKFPTGSVPAELETDVVIVGSGCGGGVAAKNIAEAGHRVVVVEKAYYQSPAQLPMTELSAAVHMFENGQILPSDSGSVSVVAGSTWGGGGSVNWSASLQTQGFVRREWASGGLEFFESVEFQKCLDRVCERMGVSTAYLEHNHGNRMLLEGSRRLGYHAYTVPQNTGGKKHHDGYCTFGCRSCEKQGPVNSWLPDAARAGAKAIEGLRIGEIIFEDRKGAKVAVGVKGKWISRDANGGLDGKERIVRDVVIRAKKVVLSAGTLWSPILLLKSGVKNYNIGRNAHLHPATWVFGVYPEEVRPWEGAILTSVCTEFENLDGQGHGVKFECAAMPPSIALTNIPWNSSHAYKTTLLKYRHMNGFIVLVRDKDSGVVYPDPVTGAPRIKYKVSELDLGHAWEGVCELAKVVFRSGAREVHLGMDGVKPFVRPGDGEDDDQAFRAWLSALQNKSPHPRYCLPFATAHQMGSCRMGTSRQSSVVDPDGKVWGIEGVYVCDASVFPSASGVNPMITNMAIADWISKGLVREIGKEKEG